MNTEERNQAVVTNLESAQQALKEARLKSPDRIYWIDKVTFQVI